METRTHAAPATDRRHETVDAVIRAGAVAVIRMTDASRLMKVVHAIYDGGVTAIEITMTVPGALSQIEMLARDMGDRLQLGVGSVLTPEVAREAVDAGAQYVVSPVFKRSIIDEAHRLGVPAMPGCFTPTEIHTAVEAGADIVKVFPADVVGMPFFKAVLAPMPRLKLMPTGGVTLTNAGDWIRTGACAVGVGSALLDKKAIAEERYDLLRENASRLMQSVREGREAVGGEK